MVMLRSRPPVPSPRVGRYDARDDDSADKEPMMTDVRLGLPISAIAAAALLSLGACAVTGTATPAPLTDADTGASRTVAVGSAVDVRLATQSGTGFSWIAEPVEGLTVGEPHTVESSGTPGAATTQVFPVSVATPGSHQLTFNYSRPWQGGEKNARTVSFTIIGR